MTQNEFPGKNPENFEKFSRFFPGPRFLPFKLFNLLIDLLRKLINEIKILCGQRWGGGKETGRCFKSTTCLSRAPQLENDHHDFVFLGMCGAPEI